LTIFSRKFNILGHSTTIGQVVLGIGTLGLLALAAHHKWLVPPVAKEAGRIMMQLNPPVLSSQRPSTLTGRFEDKDGNPVRVKMGRFLVLNQQQQVVRGGLIGPYASDFSTTIDTRGLGAGQYTVIVEDHVGQQQQKQQ
jgi:hypothetical protein